tara:strand:+ start:493 stop:870 length:378 start_codon:yes stop_codon:yes gene_type:complete
MRAIDATPSAFAFAPDEIALIIIDMQRDFIEPGGFGDTLGNDVSLLGAIVPTVRRLLDGFRAAGLPVFHTRECHLPDLSDRLLATDATESYFPAFKEAAIAMLVAQGGIIGWDAPTDTILEALHG